jgi:hypothetical protein
MRVREGQQCGYPTVSQHLSGIASPALLGGLDRPALARVRCSEERQGAGRSEEQHQQGSPCRPTETQHHAAHQCSRQRPARRKRMHTVACKGHYSRQQTGCNDGNNAAQFSVVG